MTLFEAIKSMIFITVFLCIAPFLIHSIKKQYIFLVEPRSLIGTIHISDQLKHSSSISEQLHNLFRDPLIKGIIVTIDCAHSAAGTSQIIFHDIRQLKKEYSKPIIAFIENICFSGAYLIASSCDYIIAPESALIGEIGTTFSTSAIEKVIDNNNVQNIENESYQQLVKQIALSRKLSLATITNWAEGKIFTGTQALALGLINEIGSTYTVEKVIKEKALIEGMIEKTV